LTVRLGHGPRKDLGDEAESLLGHEAKAFRARTSFCRTDFVQRIFEYSDRNPQCCATSAPLPHAASRTGTLDLPVDQGIEHSAGASFAKNPSTSTRRTFWSSRSKGVQRRGQTRLLGIVSARYVHRIPFICKLNTTTCCTTEHLRPGAFARCARRPISVRAPSGHDLLRSEQSDRQLHEVSELREAHRLGMFTCCVATCATRPSRRTASITTSRLTLGQAKHGVDIEANHQAEQAEKTAA